MRWLPLLAMICLIAGIFFTGYGITYHSEGQAPTPEEAIRESLAKYNKFTARDPSNVTAWVSMGMLHQQLGEYAEADRAYEKAIELEPGSAVVWLNKGVIRHTQGNFSDAVLLYDTGIGIDAKNPLLWANRGRALVSLGRYNEALQSYNQALALDPSPRTVCS